MITSTNEIDFKTMTGFVLESVLECIKECLIVAGKHWGDVFGGFVRDVIVPRLYNPIAAVKFKDVDIWFCSQEQADDFVKEMGSKLQIAPDYEIKSDNAIYKFARKQYHLYSHGTCVAWIDVVVSKNLPVNDFDVNGLTYLYVETGRYVSPFTSDGLLTAIHEKRTVMHPEYAEILAGGKNGVEDSAAKIHLERLQRIYLSKGWTVTLNGEVIPESVDKEWFRKKLYPAPIVAKPVFGISNPVPISSSETKISVETKNND